MRHQDRRAPLPGSNERATLESSKNTGSPQRETRITLILLREYHDSRAMRQDRL